MLPLQLYVESFKILKKSFLQNKSFYEKISFYNSFFLIHIRMLQPRHSIKFFDVI